MRKGSSRAHADWPRLRRSLTPAPSEVGTASMTRCSVREFMTDPRKMPRWGRAAALQGQRWGQDDPRASAYGAANVFRPNRIDRGLYNARDAPIVTTVLPA